MINCNKYQTTCDHDVEKCTSHCTVLRFDSQVVSNNQLTYFVVSR